MFFGGWDRLTRICRGFRIIFIVVIWGWRHHQSKYILSTLPIIIIIIINVFILLLCTGKQFQIHPTFLFALIDLSQQVLQQRFHVLFRLQWTIVLECHILSLYDNRAVFIIAIITCICVIVVIAVAVVKECTLLYTETFLHQFIIAIAINTTSIGMRVRVHVLKLIDTGMHSAHNLACHTLPKINHNPIINPSPFDPPIERADNPIIIPITAIIIRD